MKVSQSLFRLWLRVFLSCCRRSAQCYVFRVRIFPAVRERHGYGLRNLRDDLPSDQASLAQLLKRNFADREDLQNLLKLTQDVTSLYCLVKYICYEIWSPIFRKLRCFCVACDSGANPVPLTATQWVAVRRISWMLDEFSEWIKSHQIPPEYQDLKREVEAMLKRIDEEAQNYFDKVMQLDRDREGILDVNSRRAVDTEIIEEICFEFRESLPLAFDESVYCSVSRRLLTTLVKEAQKWLFRDPENHAATKQLLQCFYKAAESAKNEILQCVEKGENVSLEFTSGVQKGTVLSGALRAILSTFKTSSAFFLQYSTTPKGVGAALIDASPKLEASDRIISQAIGDRFVMVGVDGLDEHKELAALGSKPVDSSKIVGTRDKINATWYIYWQVLYLVDLFASSYCDEAGYNIHTLCTILGADERLARFVVAGGIRQTDGLGYQGFCRVKRKTNAFKKKPAQPKSSKNQRKVQVLREHRPSANSRSLEGLPSNCIYVGNPTTTFPGVGDHWPEGWTQQTYERKGGVSQGSVDHYWFPPEGKPKLRSGPDILRYLASAAAAKQTVLE